MPELVEDRSADNPDLIIQYGNVPPLKTDEKGLGTFTVIEEPGRIHFWMNEMGGMEIREGREMIVSPLPGAAEAGFRFLVSGIGIGFVLHQRGVPSLHASAVTIKGEAIAFIGWKGMGKSTTAALFHERGYPVITDDVLPLFMDEGPVMTAAAFPFLKLLPSAIEAISTKNLDHFPLVDPRGIKRNVSVEKGYTGDKMPVRCVYVLDWAEEGDTTSVQIDALSEREACIELMRHSFALRMFEQEAATPQQLRQSAQLAKRIPVRRLRRPHDLMRLQELVERVTEDLNEVHRPSTGLSASSVISSPPFG